MKTVYLVLAIIGFLIPYYFFLSFLIDHGLDLQLFFQQLFANQISTFFVLDLIIATTVFWFFVIQESRRVDLRNGWLFILLSLIIGLSFALPLFLYFRERRLENSLKPG